MFRWLLDFLLGKPVHRLDVDLVLVTSDYGNLNRLSYVSEAIRSFGGRAPGPLLPERNQDTTEAR